MQHPTLLTSSRGARTARLVCSACALLIAITLTPLAKAVTITEPDNHKVIFRYRTFSGSLPGGVSSLSSAGGISFAAGSDDIVSTNRGAGFDSLIATDFDGSTEYLQGTSTISTVDSAGDDSFTVEAWFKPNAATLSRYTSLFSTTGAGQGYSLKVVNGRLSGLVRFRNGSSAVTVTIDQEAAYPNLTADRWYYGVLHCRRQGSYYELRLYLDGVRVAYLTTASLWNGVYQSTVAPMVAADPSGSSAVDHFGGQIYAVVVSNHDVYLDNYVKNEVVRDGCRYFGTASYHDYLDTTASVDYRMQRTANNFPDLANVVERMQLPFMNDGYVPQGLGYDAASGNFYVGYYWLGVDGSIASATNNPDKLSFIAEINKSTHALRRAFRLYTATGAPNYGHMDAIEYYNGSLYVSYGTSIYRYRLSDAPNPSYVFDAATFANPRMDQNPLTIVTSYSIQNYLQGNDGTAAMNLYPDSNGDMILWTADYDPSVTKKVLGFKLNADGSLQVPAVYAFNLPITGLNGIACYQSSATDLWFYMMGGGVFRKVHYVKSSPTAVSVTTVFTAPGGTEDLTLVGTQVWTTNETGAVSYQKRTNQSAWMEDLYPFLFGMNLP
jgi:hypothetical protein